MKSSRNNRVKYSWRPLCWGQTVCWRRVLCGLLALLIPLPLTGCWDKQELDTISIVSGVGIDAAEEEDISNFIFQVVKVGTSKPEEKAASFFLMEAKGNGLLTALEDLRRKSSRALFLNQNQVLIIGKEQAEQGFEELIDAFIRTREMRLETWMLVSDVKAKDLLSAEPEQEPISAMGIERMMENEYNSSRHLTTRMLDYVASMISPAGACVIPTMGVSEINGVPVYAFTGLAVIKDAVQVGKLEIPEKRGYFWMMGDIDNGNLEVDTDQGMALLNVSEIRHVVSPKFDEEGKPYVEVEIFAQMSIGDAQGFGEQKPLEITAALEKAAAQTVEDEMQRSLAAAQELKADVFRFGEAFERFHPDRWEGMRENWDEVFETLSLRTKLHFQVRDTGKITEPYDQEVKKRREN